MIGQIILWNIVGGMAKAHNKREQEKFRAMFPKTNYQSTPKIQNIQTKPFSVYLEEAMNKIK